mgnify:CR=1 FL=1
MQDKIKRILYSYITGNLDGIDPEDGGLSSIVAEYKMLMDSIYTAKEQLACQLPKNEFGESKAVEKLMNAVDDVIRETFMTEYDYGQQVAQTLPVGECTHPAGEQMRTDLAKLISIIGKEAFRLGQEVERGHTPPVVCEYLNKDI